MKNWGLLTAPLGLVICGLSVLYLKMNPGGSKLTTDVLQGPLAYIPWLAGVIVLALFIQAVIIRRHEDTFLFPIVMMLASVGIVEIARLKPSLLVRQLQWLCVAMLVMLLVLRFWSRIRRMLSYPYLLGLVCVFLLGLPLLFGTEIGGSKNWLVLGPVSVQPSEFGKILLVFFLASYLSDHRRVLTLPSRRILFLRLPPIRFIAPLICIWGMAVLMFVVEKDLGSALLFFGMAVLMTYMATGSKSYAFLAMAFIGVAAAASYAAFGHVRVRFDIWLDPWQDPNGMAYQIVQSLFAFGTGGIWGTGFGYGHPGFIPDDDCIIRHILPVGGIIFLFHADRPAFSVRRCLIRIRPADKHYAAVWYFVEEISAVITDPFDLQAFLVQGIFIFPFGRMPVPVITERRQKTGQHERR